MHDCMITGLSVALDVILFWRLDSSLCLPLLNLLLLHQDAYDWTVTNSLLLRVTSVADASLLKMSALTSVSVAGTWAFSA
jgi:hypothetical protein